jgi:hypothetical protein
VDLTCCVAVVHSVPILGQDTHMTCQSPLFTYEWNLGRGRDPTVAALEIQSYKWTFRIRIKFVWDDTVCICFPGCRFLVSQHPAVEAKIVAELASHGLLVTQDNPAPRNLTYDDLAKLTYLGYVVKVRQRSLPPISLALSLSLSLSLSLCLSLPLSLCRSPYVCSCDSNLNH